VVWEHYPNGGSRQRLNRCFSVTKSIASALVGTAVDAGLIASVEDPVGKYLTGLRDPRVGQLTIAHLLEMRSGIRFVEGYLPWNDEPRTYYATDLRERLLEARVTDPLDRFFHYNDWHPQLLALILERATGKTVTAWLQETLWSPLGAAYPASMMVDRDDAAGVEHLESGLTEQPLISRSSASFTCRTACGTADGFFRRAGSSRRPLLATRAWIRNGSPIIAAARGDAFLRAAASITAACGGEIGWTENGSTSSPWVCSGSTSMSRPIRRR
jgi:CubicO group peptidase (beta-lactamase class C family)